jgi:plasmid stabilization system protein ParE
MPLRKRLPLLHPDAESDFETILFDTDFQWGARQRVEYKSALVNAMRSIAQYFEYGKSRNELFEGCRSYVIREHTIYYHRPEQDVIVVRILPSGLDPEGRLHP